MSAAIIDGRRYAEELKREVFDEVRMLHRDQLSCGVATLQVGHDPGSLAYVRRIKRVASELSIGCRDITLAADATEAEVLAAIDSLNGNPSVHGILVLRPLPPHVSEATVFHRLRPLKDIEAVHPENAGRLALGIPRYVPSTAASAFLVLDRWLEDCGEDLEDFYHRSALVVVGRSNNVGKPAVSLAYERGAAVTSIDEWASKTGQLGWHTRRADVLIVAAGVPGLIEAEHIREGAIVLDVGINPASDPETGETRLLGDVAFQRVSARASAITPVPGGIGPVTDVWLMRNVAAAARASAERSDQAFAFTSNEDAS